MKLSTTLLILLTVSLISKPLVDCPFCPSSTVLLLFFNNDVFLFCCTCSWLLTSQLSTNSSCTMLPPSFPWFPSQSFFPCQYLLLGCFFECFADYHVLIFLFPKQIFIYHDFKFFCFLSQLCTCEEGVYQNKKNLNH